MTAPSTIKPTRTTTPPAIEDVLVLCSQLTYTLEQILLHAPLEQVPFNAITDALRLSCQAGRLVRQAKGQ